MGFLPVFPAQMCLPAWRPVLSGDQPSLFITSKAGLCAIPVCKKQTENSQPCVLLYTIVRSITEEQTIPYEKTINLLTYLCCISAQI